MYGTTGNCGYLQQHSLGVYISANCIAHVEQFSRLKNLNPQDLNIMLCAHSPRLESYMIYFTIQVE